MAKQRASNVVEASDAAGGKALKPKKLRVMISHATADKPLIVKLRLIEGLLANENVELWVDNAAGFKGAAQEKLNKLENIKPGERWRNGLARIILNVDIILACWSQTYIAKAQPDVNDQDSGIWVRDELELAAEQSRVIHVELEGGLDIPPRFRTAFKDIQVSRLWNLEGDEASLFRECKNIVDGARRLAARRVDDFDSEFDRMALFIDRDRQEEPFVRSADTCATSGVVLVCGRPEDDPESLVERFACFTWPVRQLLNPGSGWGLGALRAQVFAGDFPKDVTRCEVIKVRDAFKCRSTKEELDFIGHVLGRDPPRLAAEPNEDPLHYALRVLGECAKKGQSFLATIVVPVEIWRDRRAHVCDVVLRLAEALAAASAPWLTVIVILAGEEAASRVSAPQALWRRLRGVASGPFEDMKERHPDDKSKPALWTRLRSLTPIDPDHAADWGALIRQAWETPLDVADRLRREFGDEALPLRDAKPKLSDGVRRLWDLRSLSRGTG